MFEYEGSQFTEQELKIEADKQGLQFGDFVQRMKKRGMTQAGESSIMGSSLEGGSLEQQEISPWQNLKNNLSNSLEMSGDFLEFWGVSQDEDTVEEALENGTLGSYSGLNIASTLIWEGTFGREKMKEWKKESPEFFENFDPSDSETFLKVIQSFEDDKSKLKQTMTFKQAESITDYLSVATGAVLNVGGSVVYNLGTGGVGFFMDFAAENFIEANKIKAESKGKSIDELLAANEADVSTPIKIAAVQAGLELFSLGKITKAIGGKSVTRELGKGLARKYATNKAVRVGLDITSTGSVEALTEMTQYGLEFYNKELARAKGEGKNISIVETVAEGMFSEEGVESGLQGLFGGAGLRGGGYSAKAIGHVRKTVSDVDVEADLNNLVDLKRKFNETKDKDVRAAVEDKIIDLTASINDKIKKGNKIYESLSSGDVSSIENLGDLADVAAYRVTELNKKLANGNISEKDHTLAVEGLTNKFKKNKQKIKTIINTANVIKQAEALSKETGKKGSVVELTSDEIKSLNEEGLDSKSASEQYGFIQQKSDGSFRIILNKDKPMVGTAAHEFMHAVLFKTVGNNESIQTGMGDALIDHVKSLGGDATALGKRLSAYGKYNKEGEFKRDANFGEEVITIMSELTVDGSLKFEENFFTKVGDVIRRFSQDYLGREITFNTGKDVYNFVKDYSKSIKDGKINKAILKVAKEGAEGKLVEGRVDPKPTTQMSKDQTDSVNEFAEMGWTDKTWKESGADFAIKEMQSNKMLDGLIRSKYKADIVPDNFVDLVYSELVNHVKNFKPESNDSLFGWVNSQIANKAGNVYNREFKVADEMKGAKDIGKTTKEGDVKIQVAAEKSSELEAFEEEDLSIQGQAKKAKADKQQYSEYRRKLGFKEGDKIYNEVLENVKKSLMIAYGTTQNIADVQLRAQAVAAKLKKEYANLNSPLFKQIKNFLTYGVADTKVPYGTKDIYISQLKKLKLINKSILSIEEN